VCSISDIAKSIEGGKRDQNYDNHGGREMSWPTNTDQSLLIVVNKDQTNQSSEEQNDEAFRRMERLHFRNYMDEFFQNAHGILERF
jgi:hypothetical protein